MKVEITDLDRERCAHLCAARYVGKRQHVENRKVADLSDGDVEMQGVLGEFAFARVAELPVGTSTELGGDKGYDFVLDDGTTVDIKASACPTARLIVRDAQLERATADVGAFQTGDWVRVRGAVGGFIAVDTLYRIVQWAVDVDSNGKESVKLAFAPLESFGD